MVKKPDPGKRQKEVRLYVEGGGDAATLKSSCREGLATFLEKAGLKGHMPRIIACGGREDAFDSFCTAIANGVNAFLLIDSEAPVAAQEANGAPPAQWQPWTHLKQRIGDGWDMPPNALSPPRFLLNTGQLVGAPNCPLFENIRNDFLK